MPLSKRVTQISPSPTEEFTRHLYKMIDKQFVTCLNCIDGRTQLPVLQWIEKNHKTSYVDLITEPGMDGLLSDQDKKFESIMTKVKFSIQKHFSKTIFIVGHHDCAGNPVDDISHKKQIHTAMRNLKSLVLPATVVGLWVSKKCSVKEIVREGE